MKAPTCLLLAMAAAVPAFGAAASADPQNPVIVQPSATAPAVAPASPAAPRAPLLSSETAANLSAATVRKSAEEQAADARSGITPAGASTPAPAAAETGAPAEGQPRMGPIIRVPTVRVEAERMPVFNDRQIYSRADVGRLAARKYFDELELNILNRVTIPLIGISPEKRALMILADEERLASMAEMEDAAQAAARAGDAEGARMIRRMSNETFARPTNWGFTETGRTLRR